MSNHAVESLEIKQELSQQWGPTDLQETIELGNISVTITEKSPSPENLVDPTPILLLQGIGVTSDRLGRSLNQFVKRGRSVMVIDHPRRGGLRSFSKYRDDFSKIEQFKAETLYSVLEAKGIDKVDLIGHCEGGINATLLALEHPEKVRSLVLLAPGGMVGEDSFVRVAEPFVKKIVRNNFKALGAIASGKPLRPQVSPGMAARRTPPIDTYLKQSPVRLLREVHATVHDRIDGVLGAVSQQGVRVGILQSHNDNLFPPERIEEHVDLEAVDGYASLAKKRALHYAFAAHPILTVGAVTQMLDSINSNDL